jgi:hypothetical protein
MPPLRWKTFRPGRPSRPPEASGSSTRACEIFVFGWKARAGSGTAARPWLKAWCAPGLGYALNENASLWLGYAFVPTMEPFATQDFNEHRIWQQFLWTGKTFLGAFTSRSRFEQRFMNQPDTAYRFRQMFKLSYPLSFAPDFSLVGSDELFVNVNTTGTIYSGFEQNRVFTGLGYNFDEHIKAEIGYMNQYIRRVERADRMTHILSLNLLLNY